MSSFTAEWLALREPADIEARSSRLVRLIADRLTGRTVRILDLATGAGANARYLAARLPYPQEWLLVDRDPSLLAATNDGRISSPAKTALMDLATELMGGATLFQGHDLVTASALLDLVSASWLAHVAQLCRNCGATVLFALTYDGRLECSPAEPEDETVRTLVNAHQQTDKGFGAALGPAACDEAVRCFERVGYEISREPSDWVLDSREAELQRQLIVGWAEAAAAMSSGLALTIDSWKRRRLDHVNEGRSRLVVGHQDLAGWIK